MKKTILLVASLLIATSALAGTGSDRQWWWMPWWETDAEQEAREAPIIAEGTNKEKNAAIETARDECGEANEFGVNEENCIRWKLSDLVNAMLDDCATNGLQ